MLNTVVTKTPQQLRFEFALWTANMVRMDLEEKFGLDVRCGSGRQDDCVRRRVGLGSAVRVREDMG